MAFVHRQAYGSDGKVTIESEVIGLDAAIRAASELGNKAPKALAGAMYREMLKVENDAKEHCPVDEGTMARAHFTTPPKIDETGIEVTTGTGGPAADYALEQHENLEFFHDDGEAKWLENAFNRARPGIAERMAADIRLEAGL